MSYDKGQRPREEKVFSTWARYADKQMGNYPEGSRRAQDMALTLTGFSRQNGQKKDMTEIRKSMRQVLGQEHARFKGETVEVWLRGVVQNGEQ